MRARSTQEWGSNPAPRRPLPRDRRSGGGVLVFGLFFVSLALLTLGSLLVAYASIARTLPPPEELQDRVSSFGSTLVYDREGGLLEEIADPNYGRRNPVPLDRISPYLINATLATEDPNFYQHPGVDPVGVARAVYYAIQEGSLDSTPGGSTITQQLVKLAFLSPERTMSRKVKEAILAAEITRRYSKDTILRLYLNEIYYGNLAYGVEAAAETYFGRPAANLTLAEAALLAGLPQAPAYYDPYTRLWEADGSPGVVKKRQGVVLSLMVRHGYLASAEADAAWAAPIRLQPRQTSAYLNEPHFVLYARSQVEEAVGPELLAKGGLKIHTTLDPRTQAIAREELKRQIQALASQNANNGAVVVIRPNTGEVLAMVGSVNFDDEKISGQINMALSPRQPGSAIKPLTYLAAFELPAPQLNETETLPGWPKEWKRDPTVSAIEPPGYWTPATALMDIRTEFPDGANPRYTPANFDDQEHGLVSVRSALANSYNIPAVKTLEHVGVERLKDAARRAGITTLTRSDYGLSLTLGGGEVMLLELTGAYAVLANGGVRIAPTPIGCILDSDGRLIWRGAAAEGIAACTGVSPAPGRVITPVPAQTAFNPQHVYLITSILSDVEARRPMFGANTELLALPDRPAAAKTGTTNDYRDAWAMGYTPDLAVGVWVGNADYTPMQKIAGSIGAAPIWRNVMARNLQGKPARAFAVPAGIQRLRVCADSGTLPTEACPSQREEVFAANQGPLPARYDLHQRIRIDKTTGKPASDFTPADRIATRDVMIFPLKYRAWAEAHGHPQLDLSLTSYAFKPELSLSSPANGSRVGGRVAIAGKVRLPDPLTWRVEYGVGSGPVGWGVVAGPYKGDAEGVLAEWDVAQAVQRHGASDYSVRLAAYDPSNYSYPVAVSNILHITTSALTPTPVALPTPRPMPTSPVQLPTLPPLPTIPALPTLRPIRP